MLAPTAGDEMRVGALAAAMAASRHASVHLSAARTDSRRPHRPGPGSLESTMVLWLVPVLWVFTTGVVAGQIVGAISWWASGLVAFAAACLTYGGQNSAWLAEVRFRRLRRELDRAERRVQATHLSLRSDDDDQVLDLAAVNSADDVTWLALMCELRWRLHVRGMFTESDKRLVDEMRSVRRDPVEGLLPCSWTALLSTRLGDPLRSPFTNSEPFVNTVEFMEVASRARLASAVVSTSRETSMSSLRAADPSTALQSWELCARLEAGGSDAVVMSKVLLDRSGEWALQDLVDTALALSAPSTTGSR